MAARGCTFKITSRQRSLAAKLLGSSALSLMLIGPGQVLPARALPASSATQSLDFSIQQQGLGSALAAFADRAGLHLLFTSELVAGRTSPGLSGSYTRAQALSHLLAGTGLTYQFTSAKAVTIVAAAPAATDMRAQVPGAITLDTVNVAGATSSEAAYNDYYQPALSSQKQTAPLLDTPQTVTIIPQAVMREQGARSLADVLRNTPGISFNAGENGFGTGTDNFSIRGFDSSGSVFYDGTRSNGVFTRDVFNVERVEVVKGASVDNGRGGPGGYVNIVTKTPYTQNFIAGDLQAGFDDYRSIARKRGTVDANYMLAPGIAFRFNGLLESSGVPGRQNAEMQPLGIAPSLAFGLGTDKRAIFSYELLRRRDIPDWGVPGARIPGTFRYDPRIAGVPRDTYYGLLSDFDYTTSHAAMARFEYDASSAVTISNQTRWASVDRKSRFTAPTGIDAAATQATTATWLYDRTTTNLSNLFNVSAKFQTGSLRHHLSSGFELSTEESYAGRFADGVPAAGNTPLFSPNPVRVGGAPFTALERNTVRINTIAGYAYDTIEFNKQWQMTGGLRIERYSVDIQSRTAAGVPTGSFSDYDNDRTTLGGKVGLVYKPVDEASLYAAFAVSNQPPASFLSNPDISRTGDNAFPGLILGADPVRALNYEVGAKYEFNKRLTLSGAGFYTDSRVPISGCTPNSPIPPAACASPEGLQGYGQQIAYGGEFGIAGKVTEEWQVFGGLLIMRAERRHSAYLDATRMAASPGDFPVGFRNGTNGQELAFTPNFTANLWTTYRFANGITLGGGVQHVGESWLGRPNDANRIIPNGVFGKLPAYTLLNLMASYAIRPEVEARFNVDNVTNRLHAVSTNWNGTRASLGIPRTYRFSVSFRF